MSRDIVLVDTSVAVAYLVQDHDLHERALQRLRGVSRGLAGHAAFETYSVLTRLPASVRVSAHVAARMINVSFPETRQLGARQQASLLKELPAKGISGGAVYDALVAAAAAQHRLPLVSADARAAATYRKLGVDAQTL